MIHMTVTVRIRKAVLAIANDNGTWSCEDPMLEQYLNIIAGKDAIKRKWVYVPNMAESMLQFALDVLSPDNVDVVNRTARRVSPDDKTVY